MRLVTYDAGDGPRAGALRDGAVVDPLGRARARAAGGLAAERARRACQRSGAEGALPAASKKVDYEAEVAFVVGRRARDVSEADALDHLAGCTLLNDLSARDLQFATPQWMPGKVFDGSAPCGPASSPPTRAGRSTRSSSS